MALKEPLLLPLPRKPPRGQGRVRRGAGKDEGEGEGEGEGGGAAQPHPQPQPQAQRKKPNISISLPPRARELDPELEAGVEEERLRTPSCELPATATGKWRPGDFSPLSWRSAAPLQRRHTVRRQRRQVLWAALSGGSPAADALCYYSADCISCGKQLRGAEARWGTGLCDLCWGTCLKDCSICKASLPLKHLQWGSGLCRRCFDSCDKECRMCGSDLAMGQLHWGTGLCDGCYNSCEKTCRICQRALEPGTLRWGSGLCDGCYDSTQKVCRICSRKLELSTLRWGSGLCDTCYDASEKTCGHCSSRIALGSMHWRTGLCDACYDSCEKTCRVCHQRLELKSLNSCTGLCDGCYSRRSEEKETCNICHSRIEAEQLHWGTGLCDSCYNDCGKLCKVCEEPIPFGQLHWGSGLCDGCYSSCEKTCKLCGQHLGLGELHWGSRLCDACFDSCEKTCWGCGVRLDVGQLHWGTGCCDACHDAGCKWKRPVRVSVSVRSGVRAAIAAQLIFYMTPGMLQPSLYLQVLRAAGRSAAPSLYAFVLTVASLSSMVLPVPLGLWAESRGEREVYYGISMLAASGAAGLAILDALGLAAAGPAGPPLFALCWAALTGPPAVRGVRAAYFAKHVPPEELSRKGQLASSMGLLGGFLGPAVSALLSILAHEAFIVLALLGSLALAACACLLAYLMPPLPKRGRKASSGSFSFSRSASKEPERCERCRGELRVQESKYALALCDACYNNYEGTNYNFRQFRTRVLIGFCLVASLLECSMNAAVIASFQPIVVTHFGWGNRAIASVNFAGAGLSVLISFLMAFIGMAERKQTAAAAGLYFFGVFLFTAPPLCEWRVIVGLMLGIKAQILFMAPFTAIFSNLIGKVRVTNRLMTALCLAPAIGAAVGTSASPVFVALADTPYFMLAAFPAALAVLAVAVGWRLIRR